MEGDIVSKNDIRLDGNLIGKMTTKKKIIIGKKGFFNGKLKCENLIVEGKIKGHGNPHGVQVHAGNTCHLSLRCRVERIR